MGLLDALLFGYRELITAADAVMVRRSQLKIVGGTLTDDGTKTILTIAGGGGSSAGGAGQVQTSDGASGFSAPTNVLAGANFCSVGASPAASGNWRSGSTFSFRALSASSTDLSVLEANGTDALYIGTDPVFTAAKQFSAIHMYSGPSGVIYLGNGGLTRLRLDAAGMTLYNVGDPLTFGYTGASSIGDIRGQSTLLLAHAVGGVDRRIIEGTSGADVIIGDPTNGGDVILRTPFGKVYLQANGSNSLVSDQTNVQPALPVVGYSAGASPWAGMNGLFSKTMTAAQSYDLAASEYANSTFAIVSNGANILRFPPATDAKAYWKFVWNVSGGGTISVRDTNGVAAAATLASGNGALYLFRNGQVKQMGAAFAVA